MSNLREFFSYKTNFKVSEDFAHSSSYFFEALDLNQDKLKDIIFFGFIYPSINSPIETPQGSLFYFGLGNSNYQLASTSQVLLPSTIHPREIALGDFNKDGKLDIFLADHGWDTNPFPGGQNQLLLSSPTGWQIGTQNLPQRKDFTHCTTVGDINNDGNLDIFLGNVDTAAAPFNASILFGDGTGKFNESTSSVPAEIRGPIRFYAAQLADLNHDGWVDLVIGNSGDKNNIRNESIVYWNDKGKFSNDKSTLLPNGFFQAQNEQVLDIKDADINNDGSNDLILLSTQNNPSYDGWSLQVLSNINGKFIDVTAESFGNNVSHMGEPYQSLKMPWVPFLKMADLNGDGSIDILLDSIKSYGYAKPENQPVIYLNDGFGHFSPIFAGEILDLNSTYKDFFSNASAFIDETGVSWINYFSYQNSIYFRELVPVKKLPKVATIKGTNSDEQIIGNELDNFLYGLGGNDLLQGGPGNDFIDGGSGLDTAKFSNPLGSSNSKNYSILKNSDSTWSVSYIGPIVSIYPPSTTDGTDQLTSIERLQFTDKNVALDLGGNAGIAAKVIGAVLGKSQVQNPTFVGIGLSYLDKGMSYSDLGALALAAIGATTNDSVVSTLWKNVIGTEATAAIKSPYIKMLNDGMKFGDLVVLAADTSFNTININLIGLTQTGIEYLPVS